MYFTYERPEFDVNDPGEITRVIREAYVNGVENAKTGKVADYIPELAKAGAEEFGICVMSADGAPNTKGAWGTRFDDVIAEALEAGPLRTEEYVLPEDIEQKLSAVEMPDKCMKYAKDLTAFYYANRQDDYEWVILPIVNFNAYYGATTFEKKYLPILPEKIFVRETIHGLCRFKVML